MSSEKLQSPNFLNLQNFPRATYITSKWTQPKSSSTFEMKRHAQISRVGSHFLRCKKQSVDFSFCGQLLCIIRFKTKVYLSQQFVVYPPRIFFKRSPKFSTSILMSNDNCSTWFCFVTRTSRLKFGHGARRAPYLECAPKRCAALDLSNFQRRKHDASLFHTWV